MNKFVVFFSHFLLFDLLSSSLESLEELRLLRDSFLCFELERFLLGDDSLSGDSDHLHERGVLCCLKYNERRNTFSAFYKWVCIDKIFTKIESLVRVYYAISLFKYAWFFFSLVKIFSRFKSILFCASWRGLQIWEKESFSLINDVKFEISFVIKNLWYEYYIVAFFFGTNDVSDMFLTHVSCISGDLFRVKLT